MNLGIVKQAVQIKITCQTESPLISEVEYCYACVKALRELSAPEEMLQELKQASRIEEVRQSFQTYFKEQKELCKDKENPRINRLLDLLLHCRVEGEITEEVREIMDEK